MWRKIPCKIAELNLEVNLACGQSFRWHNVGENVWRGPLAGYVWSLKQDDDFLHYMIHSDGNGRESDKIFHDERMHPIHTVHGNDAAEQISEPVEICTRPPAIKCTHMKILHDYFQLDVSLSDLYEKWSDADPIFKSVSSQFLGVRMLRQDPVENLFSFICSSNNHISRISGMVERMCERYGKQIAVVDGKSYHSFPTVESLAGPGVETKLRELGFGYRAKYISLSAQYILKNGGATWLHSLRHESYEDAKAQLMKLTGVGAKVADCVCLMSLDKHGAIPVDTHVWQIAARDYMPQLRSAKSVTDKIYNQIGTFFRELYGEYAGWAHSVLFSADLKKFQHRKETANDTELVKNIGKKRKAMKAAASSTPTGLLQAESKHKQIKTPALKRSRKSEQPKNEAGKKAGSRPTIQQPQGRRKSRNMKKS